MRLYPFILLTLFAQFGIFGTLFSQSQPINLIAGDASFEERFHRKPTTSDAEELRIRTHLDYAEQHLRNTPTIHLTPSQQQNRAEALDLLHSYWLAGRFPQNTTEPGRAPCFVDDRGNECAVAHLIRKTEGDDLVNALNDRYQYTLIKDMESQSLANWATDNGFQSEELALIQPTYDKIKEPAKQRRIRRRRKVPIYKEGGREGLVRAYQERFSLPDSLSFDEKISLRMQIDRKGRVQSVQLLSRFNKQAALAEIEAEIMTFSQGLRFSRPRWQDYHHKRNGTVELDLVFKLTQDDCTVADTLQLFDLRRNNGFPEYRAESKVDVLDAQTGDKVEKARIYSFQYPGTRNPATGQFQPNRKVVGGGSAGEWYPFYLTRDDHAPRTNLLISDSPNHRPVFIPDVPYQSHSLEVSMQRCISAMDHYWYDGHADPVRMVIPITKPQQ